jgi:hypothetical protein
MAHPKAGVPKEGAPVKYFAAILAGTRFTRQAELLGRLEKLLGEIDYTGGPKPFDMTDYYEEEMGPGIVRTIVSFSRLGEAPDLPRVKLATSAIEDEFSAEGGRTVNIDPGYIDYFKAVLASFKEGPQKIYLDKGVYADPVLMYQDGMWNVLPWTFPDFRDGRYMDDFDAIRKLYRAARRQV